MKVKGFLLLEATIGLVIACLSISLLSSTVGQGKKIEQKIELKVDHKLATQIKKSTGVKSIKIHDKCY